MAASCERLCLTFAGEVKHNLAMANGTSLSAPPTREERGIYGKPKVPKIRRGASLILQAAHLTEREREIVARLGRGETLEEVGEHFGVTRERIRQIAAGAYYKWMRQVKDPAKALAMIREPEFCYICGKRAIVLGLCRKHNERRKTYGDPRWKPCSHPEERRKAFWESVDKRGPDECWEWQGRIHHNGYGVMGAKTLAPDERQPAYAHRLAMIIAGHDLGDHHVLHRCDNPPCVNPAHLYLGTNLDNMRDRENGEAWEAYLERCAAETAARDAERQEAYDEYCAAKEAGGGRCPGGTAGRLQEKYGDRYGLTSKCGVYA